MQSAKTQFSIRNLFALLAIAISVGFGGVASAQLDPETRPPTQELLPETTVLFIQVDNFRDMVAKLKASSVGQLMEEEEIANLSEGLWDEAKLAYQDVKDEVGLDIDDLTALPALSLIHI